jgi:hypothetical protein
MDMEANGRIGGEPVAMTIDNQTGGELTPEELAALEQVTGMAMGGDVQPANPYLQQQQMYDQPGYNQGGQVLYAQQGVDVSDPVTGVDPGIDPYRPQFGATQGSIFSPGYLIDQTLNQPAQESVILYGPEGDVIMLTLPAELERYNQLLSEGYTTEQVQTTTETSVGQQDEGEPTKTQVRPEPIDVSKIADEDLAKTAKGLGTMFTIATALASTVGVPIASLVNTSMVAQYNDIIDTMVAKGIDTEGMEKKGSIFGGESGLYENLKDTGGKLDKDGNVIGDGKVGFGDTWLGDLLGFDGKAGVQGDNLRDSFGGSRRTGGGSDDDTPTTTPSVDNNNNSTTGVTYAQGESPLEKQIQEEVQQNYITSAAAGNKGGLMTNKKKK